MSAQASVIRNNKHYDDRGVSYWQHYGLRRDPFAASSETISYFPLPQWEEYLDLLQHLSRNNNVLLAVTGPRGIGKTTLMNQFLIEAVHDFHPSEAAIQSKLSPGEFWVLIEDTIRTCQVNADISLDPDRLLDLLTESFDLPWQSAETLAEQFDAQLENLQRCRQTCLLLIDNAHLLPTETLQSLLYMVSQQSETQMRFHVLLFGESLLKNNLTRIAEQQAYGDINCILELKPFTREETQQYLQHRLINAGLQGAMPLTPNHISRIYRQSKGLPAEINKITQYMFVNLIRQKPSLALTDWLQQHYLLLLTSSVIFLTSLTLGVYISNNNGQGNLGLNFISQSQASIPSQQKYALLSAPAASSKKFANNVAPAITQSQLMNRTLPAVDSLFASQQLSASAKGNDEKTNIASTQQFTAASEEQTAPLILARFNPASPGGADITIDSSLLSLSPAEQAQLIEANKLAPLSIAINLDKNANPMMLASNRIALQPIAATDAIIISENPLEPNGSLTAEVKSGIPDHQQASNQTQANATETSQQFKKTAKVAPPLANTIAAALTGKARLNSSEQNLLAVKPHYYTLQLVGVSKESALKKLINRHQLDNKSAYFRTVNSGKNWYVLIYGQYQTPQQAHAALASLPQAIQDLKPWVRSFSSVQEAINEGSKADV